MNDTNIACFLSVARTKNISMTARQFSMTQQAVSRNIQKLEQELGYPLLNHNSNSVLLTYAGNEFLKLFQKYDQNLHNASIMAPWLSDDLNIGLCDLADNSQSIHHAFHQIKNLYPDLRIHYIYGCESEIIKMFNDHLVDLAILPEEATGFISIPSLQRHLENLPCYIISSTSHPLAKENFSIEKLEDYPLIIVCFNETDFNNIDFHAQLIFSYFGIHAKKILSVPDIATMYTEIINNNGYAIYPATQIATDNPIFYLRPLEGISQSFSTVKPVGAQNEWIEKIEQLLLFNVHNESVLSGDKS